MNINSNLSKSELVAYSSSSLLGDLGIVFYYGAKLLQRGKIVNNLQYLTAPTRRQLQLEDRNLRIISHLIFGGFTGCRD